MNPKIEIVRIAKPEGANIIVGQTHFIKTVEDLYETLVTSVPNVKFGIAFCEASGACKVRCEGTDANLKKICADNALKVGCGHSFFILLEGAYPINVLNAVKNVPEVCSIYCATANPLEIIVVETELGRGILGVVDGSRPAGIEEESDIRWRKDFLRKIGYKL
jgi:adenosine/AMP kinase